MDTETPKPFGGFGFAIRTFYIEGRNLQIGRGWRRDPLVLKDQPKFSTAIHGNAVSEKDGVCVIGGNEIKKEFYLTINVDTDAKESWEWHKANDIGDIHADKTPAEHLRIKRLIEERLDKAPPTATLFTYDDDWEIGVKAGWSIECEVPQEVFSKIEEDVAAQLIQSVHIGIEWEAGLVRDEHAPPSYPTVWGMIRMYEGGSPEPLRGHVKMITWSPKATQVSPDHASSEAMEERASEIENENLRRVEPPLSPSTAITINVPKSVVLALWAIAIAVVALLLK